MKTNAGFTVTGLILAILVLFAPRLAFAGDVKNQFLCPHGIVDGALGNCPICSRRGGKSEDQECEEAKQVLLTDRFSPWRGQYKSVKEMDCGPAKTFAETYGWKSQNDLREEGENARRKEEYARQAAREKEEYARQARTLAESFKAITEASKNSAREISRRTGESVISTYEHSVEGSVRGQFRDSPRLPIPGASLPSTVKNYIDTANKNASSTAELDSPSRRLIEDIGNELLRQIERPNGLEPDGYESSGRRGESHYGRTTAYEPRETPSEPQPDPEQLRREAEAEALAAKLADETRRARQIFESLTRIPVGSGINNHGQFGRERASSPPRDLFDEPTQGNNAEGNRVRSGNPPRDLFDEPGLPTTPGGGRSTTLSPSRDLFDTPTVLKRGAQKTPNTLPPVDLFDH